LDQNPIFEKASISDLNKAIGGTSCTHSQKK
jgi:hypothetical protein